MTIEVTPGQARPLGATVTDTGVNFAVFSRHGTAVWLMLFDESTAGAPTHEFMLDPAIHRTGDVWHIHLSGLGHGQLYLYRVDGPYEPLEGHRFNPNKPLLDPYAKALTDDFDWDFSQAAGYDPTSPYADLSFSDTTHLAGMPKCIVYGDDGFDWQGDRPLNRPLNESIIYETHVRSLSCHPSARSAHPGTYRGVIELIPYFKKLGITAVELLPLHTFDEWEFERYNPDTRERLRNYWGYNTMSFFAVEGTYSHLGASRGEQVVAFKEMVRELHKAGLEVILDVVFNHTNEGNHMGPTLNFRGFDNSVYYMLADPPRYYMDFSGVGNSFNCLHPVAQDFIVDCLRYWVMDMHVDGFRFDLAAILTRARNGQPGFSTLVERIAEDPWLRYAKMIAEPWDIGTYQVGAFPSKDWPEWNDRFRDGVREFWRGDPGRTGELATRLTGSADLYMTSGRTPNHSINFVAAHDGFTLNDVMSYNEKHNRANGENNRDGHNHNISFNYGVEGPTNDPCIEKWRNRQVKNCLATLLLAQGTPMLNGGDEFRRTQQGNNNAYCQHNEISWYDWSFVTRYDDVFRFTQYVIAQRKAHPTFRRIRFFEGRDKAGNRHNDVHWYDRNGADAGWGEFDRCLMAVLDGHKSEIGADIHDSDVLMMFNADFESHLFFIPHAPQGRPWHLMLDTGLPVGYDVYPPHHEPPLRPAAVYHMRPRSMAVMITR